MQWENLASDLLKRVSIAPGSTSLADALIDNLRLEPGLKVLDICPGSGLLAAMVAKEFDVEVTCVTGNSAIEASTETTAAALGVGDKVRVIPGVPAELPLPAEEFDRVYCLGQPWPPPTSHSVVSEVYRVLKPDCIVGLAGPAALLNTTPDYMTEALKEISGAAFKTPAYSALMFAQGGFHIVTAEFFSESFDYWRDWMNAVPDEIASDVFKRAVIEDAGKWLALGLVILRKPPKPNWAV